MVPNREKACVLLLDYACKKNTVLAGFQKTNVTHMARGRGSLDVGLFLADAFYNALREHWHEQLQEQLQDHWHSIRSHIDWDPEKVAIIRLNPESDRSIPLECEDHARCLEAGLPAEAGSSRVQILEVETSEEELATANVLLVVGHNRSADQLDVLVRKLLRIFAQPRPSLYLVVFGVCESMQAGWLLADAGVTSICHMGEPSAEDIWAFDARLRDELLKGPDPTSLSSQGVLLSQICSAFNSACAAWPPDSQKPCLCLPSRMGCLRYWYRKHRFSLTCLVLACLIYWILSKAWRIHITPRIYASEEVKQCRAAEPFSLEEVTGVLAYSLLLDATCYDPRRTMLQEWFGGFWTPESMTRLDKYSSEVVLPTYLLISHTVVSVGEAIKIFEKQSTGCHFIITRAGYLVQQVQEEHKAYSIKGCLQRSAPGNCNAQEANAHAIGVAFEGNGCVSNFTEPQYATFKYLVIMLRRKGYNIPDEHVLPLPAADYLHGRHVAPGRYFDWRRLQKFLPDIRLHGSWHGAPLRFREEWMTSVHLHHKAIGSSDFDFRP